MRTIQTTGKQRSEIMTTSTTAAFNAGVAFAQFLNSDPREAQNWGELSVTDGIPDGDYLELKNEFGECTHEMEQQFQIGFNQTFVSVQ